jgi:hypothetical protein
MSPTEANSPAPSDDRQKWTQFYNELRAERDQLRQELCKMREAYQTLYFGFVVMGRLDSPYTLAEVCDLTSHQPWLQELIAELSHENA